jgi:hypothetical protein
MKKIGLLLFSFTIGAFLSGCATSPVINSFMNPAVPAEEHSFLSIDSTVLIESIDGDMTFRSSGSGSSTFKRIPLILLVPGRHTIQVWYQDAFTGKTTSTGINSNSIPVSAMFLKGHYYTLYPEVGGGMVSFALRDETDNPAIVADRRSRVSKAKPPKSPSSEVLMRVAEAQDPTPFEGSWKLETSDLISEYVFRSKTFTVVSTRKKGGVFGSRGTFEYTDNEFTLYALEMYNPTDKTWFKLPRLGKARGSTFPYELSGDSITLQADRNTTSVLVKQGE